jgi:hypothetical protein
MNQSRHPGSAAPSAAYCASSTASTDRLHPVTVLREKSQAKPQSHNENRAKLCAFAPPRETFVKNLE